MKKDSKLYLIYGTEHALFHEEVRKIINKYVEPKNRDFNVITYDLTEVPVQTVVEDALTMPFFGDHKVIVVHQAQIFTSERSKIDHNLEDFLEYLNSPSPFTVLILLAPYEKLDERKKITKKCKEAASIMIFNSPKRTEDAIAFVRQKCQEKGLIISQDACHKMVDLVGEQLSVLVKEIEKCEVAILHQNSRNITLELVENLVSRSLQDDVFKMTDLMIDKKSVEAIEILNDLKKQHIEPFLIVGAITSSLRVMYQVKILQSRGYSESEMASKLKVAPFRIKKANQKVRSLSKENLSKWIQGISIVDQNLKTTGNDPFLAIEFYILSFT